MVDDVRAQYLVAAGGKLAASRVIPKGGAVSNAAEGVVQTAGQAASGAGGEAGAQLATDGKIRPGEVALEGIAEIPGGVLETTTATLTGAREQRQGSAPTPEAPEQSSNADYLNGGGLNDEGEPESVTPSDEDIEREIDAEMEAARRGLSAAGDAPVREDGDAQAQPAPEVARGAEGVGDAEAEATPPPADEVAGNQGDETVVAPQDRPGGLGVNGRDIVEAPLDELTLSEDVPQFKAGANDEGVVEPLGGSFDRTGVAPIQVWVRNDGRKEVVTGRHRLDLARRSAEQTIPAQYHYESDGFDAADAAALDGVLNIRDGQGEVKDYVSFFRNADEITRDEAESDGLLARSKGRRGWEIAQSGSPLLVEAHQADELSNEAAYRIASAAPGDERLQSLGMKQIQQGKPITVAENMMRAVQSLAPDGAGQGDMFGLDDSAMRDAEAMARAASKREREIQDRISAVQGAARRPEKAKAEGVDVRDPEAVNKRLDALRAERDRWRRWETDPDLVAQVREDAGVGDGFELDTYTSDDIRAREQEQAAAEAEDAEKRRRSAADAQVDDFGLTGSDLPADANPAQTDLVSSPPTQAQQPATQAPPQSGASSFTPTHKLPSGEQVAATDEPGVFVNAEGVEIEDANATPLDSRQSERPKPQPKTRPSAPRQDSEATPESPAPDYTEWRWRELQAEAKRRGLPAKGSKRDLVSRLQFRDETDAAGEQTDTAPTDGQKEADNYRKGRVRAFGREIAIENPQGSTRSGTDEDGNEWSTTLAHDYGDIKGTTAADGDNLDVFLGPDAPEAAPVFVIDQVNEDGSFDEHKVMAGFGSEQAARDGYLANYEDGWQGLGSITRMEPDEFRAWLDEGDHTQPAAGEGGGSETVDPRAESGTDDLARRATERLAAENPSLIQVAQVNPRENARQALWRAWQNSVAAIVSEDENVDANAANELLQQSGVIPDSEVQWLAEQPTPERTEADKSPAQELRERAEELERQAGELPIPVRLNDVPMSEAQAAHAGTSMSPERRGLQRQMEYVAEMVDVYERMAPLADTEEKQATLKDELARYKTGYLKRLRAKLGADSRTMSAMVAGPSNFPSRRNAKRNETANRRTDELLDWSERARKAIRKKLTPERQPVSSTDPDAVEKLRTQLAERERVQEQMKAANRVVRRKGLTDEQRVEQLQGVGLSENQARELLEPDFAGRTGFADHALRNNNSQIKRLKERITDLESRADKAGDGPIEESFDGGTVEVDYADGYVRIRHDEKPPAEVRQQLKSAGFRWAPSEGAWRRKVTPAALAAADKVLGTQLAGGEGVRMSLRPQVRTEWGDGFPDALILNTPRAVQQHPDYRAAKDGDTNAAFRLVGATVDDQDINAIADAVGERTPVVVGVHAEERTGQNKIPLAFAQRIADALGYDLDGEIVQNWKVNRGGSDGFHRIANPPTFDGEVQAGRDYVIVDDTLAQGGTIAALKGYIEARGGNVVLASSLMGKQYSATLKPAPETLSQLRERYGQDFEQWFQREFGYGLDKLTQSEARYLATVRGQDADSVRGRLIAARQEGSDRASASSVPGAVDDPADSPRFRQPLDGESTPTSGPYRAQIVRRGVEDAAARMPGGPATRVVPSARHLPESLWREIESRGVESRVRGLYHDGRVYIIADNARSMAEVEEAMLHEIVGHYGVRAALGDDFKPLLNEVYRAYEDDPRLAQIVRGYRLDTGTESGRFEAAEELIAHMAQSGERPGLFRRVMARIRAFIRKSFPRLARLLGTFNDTDLWGVIERGWRAVQERPNGETHQGDSTVEARAQMVWHGSPYRFDRFSLDAIGTGEGALAYGWGLYFAGERAVAEYYRNNLAAVPSVVEFLSNAGISEGNTQAVASYIAEEAQRQGGDLQAVAANLANLYDESDTSADAVDARIAAAMLRDAPENLIDSQGSLVQADIPDDADLLDWEAPISAQPEAVQAGIEAATAALESRDPAGGALPRGIMQDDGTGGAFVQALAAGMGRADEVQAKREAAELLDEHGVPGLKYLDAVSRNNGDGARNYVIWDEDLVTVEAVNDELVQSRQEEGAPRFNLRDTDTIYGYAQDGELAAIAKHRGSQWFTVVYRGGNGELFERGKQVFKERSASAVSKRMADAGLTSDFAPGARERAQQAPLFTDGFTVPSATAWSHLVYNFQDQFTDLKKVQTTLRDLGVQIDDASNAYMREALYHGRAQKRVETFREEHVKPLLDHMRANGLTVSDVSEYLYARHAPERNAAKQKQNPTLGPGEGSGMTDEEAAQVIARYEEAGQLNALKEAAERVDAITEMDRELKVASGLEDARRVESWRNTYEHYVPLRGFEVKDDDADAPAPVRRGRGFDTRGNDPRAYGRRSKADNVLVNVLASYESTAVRAEKNRVGKSLLRMVQANPNPSLWEINPVEMKPTMGTDGLVHYQADTSVRRQDNVVVVKDRGKDVAIALHTERGKRIAAAMKNMSLSEVNTAVKIGGAVNRYLSMVSTGLNPEFMITNAIRDVQTAAFNLTDTDVDQMGARMIRDWGKAWRGIRHAQKGKVDSAWSKHFEHFERVGGKTGWVDAHQDIDRITDELRRLQRSKADPRSMARALGEMMTRQNEAVENAVRLSAFVHAMRQGLSEDQAAYLAKNLTVNFNRRGAYGQVMNAAYLFFNASVQGSARLVQAAATSRRWRRRALAFVFLSAASDIANRVMSQPDDDDEPNPYDQIPDWVKERNFIVMLGDDSYLSFPLPYGYNVLKVIGDQIGEAGMAAAGASDWSAGDGAFNVLSAFLGSFNPLGGQVLDTESGWLQAALPTLADPPIQILTNEDWAGRAIYPEANPFDLAPAPDSARAWPTTNAVAKLTAESLNAATGGSSVTPGMLDVSPATLQYLTEFAAGGVGRFALDSMDTIVGMAAGEDVPSYKVPVFGKVYGEVTDRADTGLFYDNLREVSYIQKELEKAKEKRDFRKVGRIQREQREALRLADYGDQVRKELGHINDQLDELGNAPYSEAVKKARRRRLKEKRLELIRRYNRMVERALD
ncbi:hypothetical protein NYO91_04390 [Arhodomonas aquaeolei]|uniref:LPD38 domain-containing protein n=1 Tax=Arhodomonas aquaeolei TaxID=2369 RepID=UPI0021695F16|nr:LPD38 domain-containing protein [Arhodomonas aquaeolei]MCS4503315.1 hypothetical protein [Arhodomonas aquaeolei]